MPSLTDVDLPYAFSYKNNVTVSGSTHFILLSFIVIGALYPFFKIQTPEMHEQCLSVIEGADDTTELWIGSSVCPFENVTALDLSKYPNLRSVTIGDESFMYVEEVKLIGLSELESVVIGMNSFTKEKNRYSNDPNRHFYLKNCPKLKSLKMGRFSFSDYFVIEIENVDALEVIEMGDLNEMSLNFYWASLELKSILIHSQ